MHLPEVNLPEVNPAEVKPGKAVRSDAGKPVAAHAAAPGDDHALERARAFAEPLLAGQWLDTGEGALAVLRSMGGSPALCAAAYLVYAGDHLQRPEEMVRKAFGQSYASLVTLTRQLVQIQRNARGAQALAGQGSGRHAAQRALQTERVRKMLLAFSRDLRVVLLRLASRLQTLRWFAATRTRCPEELALETLQVFAPLANRLGIWRVKWELEDLAFRALHPAEYQRVAALVDETRAEREQGVEAARAALARLLTEAGIGADVHGRPKHLHSIWKKMQGKGLNFARVFDTRALRVIVPDVAACYAALARVHEAWAPVAGEFDDYIARSKNNGYQSLHTVVLGHDGRPLEVQIRTRAMHEHAEHGVAAHWMYKEAGARGQAGVSATGDFEERVAEARKAVLRELLAWERDFVNQGQGADGETQAATPAGGNRAAFDDRIYVFTPQARIIDLPAGGTPIDFAYSLHTDLGHRCRGAKVDGRVVPLNTPLRSGQTVDIVSIKDGGPSLDWLNHDLGYLKSPRSRAKVRAWFNARAQGETIARGRELVEKLMQREGRTALKLDALAGQLGFDGADALFEVVGKDEFSLRHIENLLRPAEPAADDDKVILHRPRSGVGGPGGVLVVGVDSLLTTLARCCRPAPPDAISGFVTRGRGVAVHRRECSNLVNMARGSPGRVIDVEWGAADNEAGAAAQSAALRPLYPLDVLIEAGDRQGLLRDISEVFAKEKMNVTGVHSQMAKDRGTAWMTFTVETTDTARLAQVLAHVSRIAGVRHARRK
ncbi:MAG: bifunctional (p)ppGpp synthetase/guanosine-3',5'-bis(diphosphate) 3'-pyrophosphohydrolase [Chitinophagaceae bacterium]|nr:bifunctional (p)ppGpp synthetase/guanosine-3',5'-bis(diphosphate) 3'-pyrophosphohydrolase [Rubrivivax sp.]